MSEPIGREEQQIAVRARALFGASKGQLDAGTRSRLARARSEAVAAAGSRWFWGWLPAAPAAALSGLAAILLVAVLISLSDERVAAIDQSGAAAVIGDLDILLEGESLELFEDLEFYAWLLEQPELLDAESDADGNG